MTDTLDLRRHGSRRALATIAAALILGLSGCGSTPPTSAGVAHVTPLPPAASGSPGAATPSPGLRIVAGPNPATATIRVARSRLRLLSPRSRAVALIFGRTILVCGGLLSSGTTGAILAIDLSSGQVRSVGRLPAPVHDAGGAALGTLGLVIGGGRFGPGSTVQRVGATGHSTIVGHLSGARADLAAVAIDGEIVVAGGGTPARPDPRVLTTTDGIRFRTVARLITAVRYPAIAALGGLVYVIGGSSPSGDVRDIQSIDPLTGAVRIVGHLTRGLSHASAFVVGGQLFVAGGRRNGRAQDSVWSVAPSGATHLAGRLPYAESDSAAVVVDGVGYLIGGEGVGPVASIITISVR